MRPSEIRIGGRVKIGGCDLEGFIKSNKLRIELVGHVLFCLINISPCDQSHSDWGFYTKLHNVERMYKL